MNNDAQMMLIKTIESWRKETSEEVEIARVDKYKELELYLWGKETAYEEVITLLKDIVQHEIPFTLQ